MTCGRALELDGLFLQYSVEFMVNFVEAVQGDRKGMGFAADSLWLKLFTMRPWINLLYLSLFLHKYNRSNDTYLVGED